MVDQASATEEKLSILIGLALKLVSLCNHNLLGLKRLNEDVWVINFVLGKTDISRNEKGK